jgi:hypothetical protein
MAGSNSDPYESQFVSASASETQQQQFFAEPTTAAMAAAVGALSPHRHIAEEDRVRFLASTCSCAFGLPFANASWLFSRSVDYSRAPILPCISHPSSLCFTDTHEALTRIRNVCTADETFSLASYLELSKLADYCRTHGSQALALAMAFVLDEEAAERAVHLFTALLLYWLSRFVEQTLPTASKSLAALWCEFAPPGLDAGFKPEELVAATPALQSYIKVLPESWKYIVTHTGILSGFLITDFRVLHVLLRAAREVRAKLAPAELVLLAHECANPRPMIGHDEMTTEFLRGYEVATDVHALLEQSCLARDAPKAPGQERKRSRGSSFSYSYSYSYNSSSNSDSDTSRSLSARDTVALSRTRSRKRARHE